MPDDLIEKAAADIIDKVVAQVGGDLDRVRMIAQAQILAGRALNRLAFMAQSEHLVLDHLTVVGVVSDVAREEAARANPQSADEAAA